MDGRLKLRLQYLPGWEKLGVIKGPGTGIETVLPIPGGGLGGPHWGLLQIPFPYVPYVS